jgi:hypothetical protein
MTNQDQPFAVTQNESAPPPAQLWIGTHDALLGEAQQYLQQFFCSNGGCGTCTTCMQIRQQQHHGSIWINPEKGYTLESLAIIFETLSFSLNADQHIFFILQKADYLTTACANSLLKSLEEPTHGYHFILLAQRQDALLPTIKSRCIIKTFATHSIDPAYEQLYALLTSNTTHDPAVFLKAIDTSKINERESSELLDALFCYWIRVYAQSANKEDVNLGVTALAKLDVLKKALLEPPMPGSSKLFWKNVFLQMAA